jgi:hypothetical protein
MSRKTIRRHILEKSTPHSYGCENIQQSMRNSKVCGTPCCGLFRRTVRTFNKKNWETPRETCQDNRCPGRKSNKELPNTRQKRRCLSHLPVSPISGTTPCLFWELHVAMGPKHNLWASSVSELLPEYKASHHCCENFKPNILPNS